ncbi:two-component system phosphate regulon sensor histidine kinase PhoR [Bacillus pakistanensis]|uniref:histidine kinase n=1 Tax=Rossellomorea pakistanensis TaxID=992288 RepID=A0ABS2NBG3_9BACI|nr:ATP-binding protein [Bacillus pakistanensis]MBM7584921.1 two-component system phosphate regulon sensor histidine kinase PhoR [Bacillus pakistanensis]
MTRFRSKLLFALITLIIVVLIGLGLLLGQIFKSYYLNTFNTRIVKEAKVLANQMEEVGGIHNISESFIKENSRLLEVRLTVTDHNGSIIKDSGALKSANNRKQEEKIKKIASDWDQSKRQSQLTAEGQEIRFYWQPLYSNGEKIDGLLIVSTKIDALQQEYRQIWIVLSVSLGISLIVIILLGIRITSQYTKPIDSATKVAIELAKGNYRARTYEDHLDETSNLSTSINILARNLQEMISAQEMQQDRLSTLIENMGSALLLIDHRGYVVLINRAYKEFFEINPAEFLNKRYHEVILNSEVNKLVEEIFMTEQKIRKQLLLPLKIERRHFEVYGAPIIGTNDRWNGILIVFHDITELKKLEQMRKDFVANVSHELKTPITSIKGFSETLLDGAMHDQKALESFLTIILKESDRLQSLIQDLLELSKIEKQGFEMSFQPVDLSQIISEVVAILEGKAQEKEISIIFKPISSSVAEVDSYRIKQVFINLITNAISYTPNGGTVEVKMTQGNEKIVITVADNGIGIEPEEIPRIFERFYRVDKARSRNSGGTGLGLAIVKHLIEAHKGTIEVTSKVDKGTTFTVTLLKNTKIEQ